MKKHLFSGEGIFTALLFLTGIIWLVSGLRTGIWERVTLDGGFILLFVGVFVCLLSVVAFIRMTRLKAKEPHEPEVESTGLDKKLLFTLLFTIIGLLAMQYVLGTIVALTVFLILWLRGYRKIAWIKSLIITACVMAIIYSVFILWLKVRFPTFLDLGII